MRETLARFLGRKDLLESDRVPTPVFLGFPGGSAGKELACNVRDLGSIPELGRSPGERNSYPLQYSGLVNSMDYIVHGSQRFRHSWVTFTFTPLHWVGRSHRLPSPSKPPYVLSLDILNGFTGPGECMCVCVLSRVRLSLTPSTAARQVPLSLGFSRQESWSGLPFPPSGDLPDQEMEPLVFWVSCIGRWILYP